MSTRPLYTLKHPMVREITSADGVREDIIRPAGHTFELRRSTVADAKAIEKIGGDIDKALYMMSRATRLTLEELAYLDLLDMKLLGEELENFTDPEKGKERAKAKALAEAGSPDGQTPKISSAA